MQLSRKTGQAFERIGGVYALPVILMIVALPLVGSFSSWVTLTVAGLAMGMMIFLMASGLSLVFGLMDVLNLGHSAFISFGAFIAASVLAALSAWVGADSLALNLLALFAAIALAGHVRLRSRHLLRTASHPPGLWRPSQADPGHHRRPDRFGGTGSRDLG